MLKVVPFPSGGGGGSPTMAFDFNGRAYCTLNSRWSTFHIVRGNNDYNMANTTTGSAALPVHAEDHNGILIPVDITGAKYLVRLVGDKNNPTAEFETSLDVWRNDNTQHHVGKAAFTGIQIGEGKYFDLVDEPTFEFKAGDIVFFSVRKITGLQCYPTVAATLVVGG